MTQMVTRCPKCATAFRITSTQLESAKGAVRCGSCLHIFKAQDYLVKSATPASNSAIQHQPLAHNPPKDVLVEQQPAPEATAAQPAAITKPPVSPIPVHSAGAEKDTPVKPIIDKAKALEDEDDILISDDMDKVENKESTYEFDGFLDINLNPKQSVSLFEREIRYEAPRDETEEIEDESWAEELLDDEDETLHQLKKPSPPLTDSDAVGEFASTPQIETAPEATPSYSGPLFSLISEQPAEQQEEPVFSEEFLHATRGTDTAPAVTTESSAFAAALFTQDTPATEEPDVSASKRPVKSSKMRAFDNSRAALLMNIMPAPVEFTAKRMRRWYQQKLWPSLAILMAALLLFQISYFKFDYFSRAEPYRTAYLFICPLLGCEVPALVDTTQILATNLIVRNHPEIANALMVDAILINNAPFEQPFPDLILSFSKLDETPVASRRFTPREYLAGELAGMKYIPERQPVHITLEIADPGPDAVNYSLDTH